MIEITNISKNYGKQTVLNNISFNIAPGEIVGVLGPNGAGKSTLLTEVAKYLSKKKEPAGYLPQENPLFDELKPIDNIKMWCNLSKSEIIEKLNEAPLSALGITNFLNKKVSEMSGGMKKRVALATVLINNPKLLMLDEPLSALDLPLKSDFINFVKYYVSLGNSVLLTSHDKDLFEICNNIYLLKNGSLSNIRPYLDQGTALVDLLR